MFRKQRGQGAMEYLMTYGWAILVVMIVGVVMWQLGIFNMGSTSLTFSGFSKIKPQLAGSALAANGDLEAIFTNGAGATIDLSDAGGSGPAVTDLAGSSPCAPSVITYGGDTLTAIVVGSNFKLSGGGCISGAQGGVYQIRVTIPYTINIGGIVTSHTETGIIRGPYE